MNICILTSMASYKSRLKELATKYNCVVVDGGKHPKIIHPTLGCITTASGTPSNKDIAIKRTEEYILDAFEKPKAAPKPVKTYGNIFPGMKTTQDERRARREAFLRAAVQGTPLPYRPSGTPGSFAAFEHHCIAA